MANAIPQVEYAAMVKDPSRKTHHEKSVNKNRSGNDLVSWSRITQTVQRNRDATKSWMLQLPTTMCRHLACNDV